MVRATLKTCPWCGGPLVFNQFYPVRRLVPGDIRSVFEEDIPQPLRTVPAWACSTALCRYRERESFIPNP